MSAEPILDMGRKPAPKPGIYRDVPFDEYSAWDAVNSHLLNGFSRTPAHVKHDISHGGLDPRPALEEGWLLHQAVLEPDEFAEYGAGLVVPPKVDRRKKEGKRIWADFELANQDKVIVEPKEYEAVQKTRRKVEAMRDALLSHPSAGEYLRSKGANEVSLVWVDESTGVICKARIDRVGMLGDWPIVGDVKTARNAGRRAFERAIAEYGYHVQAQHYLAGLQVLAPIVEGQPFRRFCFFVVENVPPHCVAVWELDESALAAAEQDRQRYLRTWRQCVETGEWPGYGAGVDLVSLPPWAFCATPEIG